VLISFTRATRTNWRHRTSTNQSFDSQVFIMVEQDKNNTSVTKDIFDQFSQACTENYSVG
jgi:hypothetical protein